MTVNAGSIAIEFALIGPALLFTLAVVGEIGLVSYYQVRVENAVYEATRAVRLGSASLTNSDVHSRFCGALQGSLASCDGLYPATLYVAPSSDLSQDLAKPEAFSTNSISIGELGDRIIVIGGFQWQPIVPLFWQLAGFSSGGAPRLIATNLAARQGEPI